MAAARQRIWVWLLLTTFIAGVTGILGFLAGQSGQLQFPIIPQLQSPAQVAPSGATYWVPLDEVRRRIHDQYVEPVPDADLVSGAIRGLVEATGDKYSVYMNKERYTQFREHLKESFGGIGVVVEPKDGFLTIVRPLRGTPGDRAGLLPGDRIIKVNDRDVTQLSVDEAVQLIRGPSGSTVRLTIVRVPGTTGREVALVREEIQTPNSVHRMVAPGVGYLQIIEFNDNVHAKVAKAILELRKLGMKGLVLDLRQNPGGLLTEAVDVASLFVPAGPVVHVIDRNGHKETHNSHGKGFDLPLVVLIDEGSASASEIVAGAIRDRGVGVLVGAKSFGKGSVQTFFTLADGAGLKLTTARYLTPKEHSINGIGIIPDVQVAVPALQAGGRAPDLDDPQNPQLLKAIELIHQRIKG